MLRNLSLSLLTFALMIGIASAESSKPGLLILSHGSPSPAWKEAIVNLVKKVELLNAEKKIFHAIIGANMEFTLPDAATGIATLEAAGCDRIIVVPVFVCPTSHTHFDVPAVLGLYSSPSTRKALKEHHAKIAAPKVPVTVTQTMSEGDLLDWFVEDEVRALSKNPKEESVLLVAHGDEAHALMVAKIMSRLFAKACGSAGITSGQIIYCQVGQYTRNVIPAIIELSENKTKSVLVIGVYLATPAKSLHERASKMGAPMEHAPAEDSHAGHSHAGHAHGQSDGNLLDGIDIRLSDKGVIDHPKMPQWVLDTAAAAL